MDLRKVKSLIDLVSESDISELEISEGQDKVKIVKTAKDAGSYVRSIPKEHITSHDRQEENNSIDSSLEDLKKQSFLKEEGLLIVSPMVGTFYRAPSPNSEPFVKIGDQIKEGQTICVVEAMKLMNEVPSDKNGKIKEILVENGQPVEFGQALFRLA
jgi:acetyl-CoA carboxylase biotin carboxyl carrier protein